MSVEDLARMIAAGGVTVEQRADIWVVSVGSREIGRGASQDEALADAAKTMLQPVAERALSAGIRWLLDRCGPG